MDTFFVLDPYPETQRRLPLSTTNQRFLENNTIWSSSPEPNCAGIEGDAGVAAF